MFSELYKNKNVQVSLTLRTRLRGLLLEETQMYLMFILSIEQWVVCNQLNIDKDIYSLI